MYDLKCDVCKNFVSAIYRINNNSVCNTCYKKYFKSANPVYVSKYINLVCKAKDDKIAELTEICNDYHNICNSYERVCDEDCNNMLSDLNDIRSVVEMYAKGIGAKNYNDRIKPILNHIDYKINKLKENK